MTSEELEAIKQRTREQWAKVQQAAKPCTGVMTIFADEAEREKFIREIKDAINAGAPF